MPRLGSRVERQRNSSPQDAGFGVRNSGFRVFAHVIPELQFGSGRDAGFAIRVLGVMPDLQFRLLTNAMSQFIPRALP